MEMFKLTLPLLLLLSTCDVPSVDSICSKFPFGHMCRNIDLTAFCLQVSQMLHIRDENKQKRIYQQFEKIFEKLADEPISAKEPFVYYGAYKQSPTSRHCTVERCNPKALTPPASCPSPEPQCEPPLVKHPGGYMIPATPPSGPAPPNPCIQNNCFCCKKPPSGKHWTGTIWTLNDGCELKYIKAPIYPGVDLLTDPPASAPGSPIFKFGSMIPTADKNPYEIEVTEITVEGARLHNWLHVAIIHNTQAPAVSDPMLTLGKEGEIKMAFIIAHDAQGFPVGEFVNTIPCGDCDGKCKPIDPSAPDEKWCHQGTRKDHIPCMFDSRRVVTNTGMMMVYAKSEGLKSIHTSWRFSQSSSPENFITEIHFRALVVDDFTKLTMYGVGGTSGDLNVRLSGMAERRIPKTGMFGWNPVYPIIHPTLQTVGAWDHFREDVSSDIDCHVELSEQYYTIEPYPDSGEAIRPIIKKDATAPPTPPPSVSNPDPFDGLPGDGREKQHCYRLRLDKAPFVLPPKPIPPKETIDFCDAAGTPTTFVPVKCPGFGKATIEPHFHDGYGFLYSSLNDPEQTYPWFLSGGRTEAYIIREGAVDPNNWKTWNAKPNHNLYWGTKPKNNLNEIDQPECELRPTQRYGKLHKHAYPTKSNNYDTSGFYGHLCTDGSGRRVLNLKTPVSSWPNTLAELNKLPTVTGVSFFEDRCYCPRIPPTPDPRYIAPPITQIQGRRQHAYQMIIAWNCIVPFGFFVSRYYKETYSKVFFLQEYWWYTIHVLCMVSAAMFTFGGIYVMELKRIKPINWDDPQISAHIILGSIVICLFFVQVFTGFFRVRDLKKRMVNIFTHWFLGVLEYVLAGIVL
ncbi:unnamed protein product [Orchesella dallaii]|uniref:ascorbate ferrireductase (transmembrane) n=1 Tax=Orchesella dallaii TaxID=48710 RepID=A0ABP1QH68_9HEXA